MTLDVEAVAVWTYVSTDRRVLVPWDDALAGSGLPDLHSLAVAADALARESLIDASWVDDIAYLTLSTLAARELGVEVRRNRRAGTGLGSLVWGRTASRRRRDRCRPEELPSDVSEARRTILEDDAVARRAVEDERAEDRGSSRRAAPSVLLEGCRAWTRSPGVPCLACRGRKLSRSTYCLRCDRWGSDRQSAKVRRSCALSPL
jgi:hypothetical protein